MMGLLSCGSYIWTLGCSVWSEKEVFRKFLPECMCVWGGREEGGGESRSSTCPMFHGDVSEEPVRWAHA